MFFTSKAFWTATSERAVKSFGQGVVGAMTADALTDAFSLNYMQLAGAGLGMGLLSVVTSLASATIGDKGTPSLGPEVLARKVEAVVEPTSPTGAVAGAGSEIPEGAPVSVEPVEPEPFMDGVTVQDLVDHALSQPMADTKAQAAYHPRHAAPSPDDEPKPSGYWGGI